MAFFSNLVSDSAFTSVQVLMHSRVFSTMYFSVDRMKNGYFIEIYRVNLAQTKNVLAENWLPILSNYKDKTAH